MKKINILIAMIVVVTISTCFVSKSRAGSLFGDLAEASIKKVLKGKDASDAVTSSGISIAYKSIGGLIETGVDRMSNRNLDEYDLGQLAKVASRGTSGETYSWKNPYVRKKYEAVPKPIKIAKGKRTREIVVFPKGSTRNSYTVKAVSDGNGRWAFNF